MIQACLLFCVTYIKAQPLALFFFLTYISDLNQAIKFYKVHHFADDINLINFNSSTNVINKQVKKDLKNLSNLLNANKICLSVSKTELVLLKSAKKTTGLWLKN